MSTPPNTAPALVVPAALPPRPSRSALGLPPGSVRAMLTLLIVGLVCVLVLIPPTDPAHPTPLPAYLLYLLFITLGHYFAAHGHSIRQRGEGGHSPLYLPGGVIRLVILVALVGTFTWQWMNHPDVLLQQLRESVDDIQRQPYLPLVILAGFFIGVVVRTLVGRNNVSYVWQDIEAWFALLGVIGLCIEILILLVINPTLEPEQRLTLPNWQGFLSGIVAFYFGARS
jgi:hypothetical protein